MSISQTALTVVFSSADSRKQVQEAFELLHDMEAEQCNKRLAALGIKVKFRNESPYPERMSGVGAVLDMDLTHDPGFKFPPAMLKKLPDAVLVVVNTMTDSGGKKSYLYGGEPITKDELVEKLETMDPRLAFVLSKNLGVRLAMRFFKALKDKHEIYPDMPLFWHLIGFLEDSKDVQKVFGSCDLALRSPAGDTILHFAARSIGQCFNEDIRWLIAHGCDVNAVNHDGDTPLLVASRMPEKRRDALFPLMEAGADLEATDRSGCRAVHYLAQQGFYDWSMGALLERGADPNAASPLGSPLWLANRSCRDRARHILWPLGCKLIAARDAYGSGAYANVLTAIHHHDLEKMAENFGKLALSERQAQELHCHAFHYQCGASFDLLLKAHPWRPTASSRDFIHGNDYLMNSLGLLRFEKTEAGDSYRMFISVIEFSSDESVQELSLSREFATNCLRVIRSRNEQAVQFFSLLHKKKVDLDELFKRHGLTLRWSREELEELPVKVGAVVQQLRKLGLVFHGSEAGLAGAGLSQELIDSLCQ